MTAPLSKSTPPLMAPPLMEIHNLTKTFPVAQSLLSRWRGQPKRTVQALTDVELTVRRGETLGIVGESGCGKSTLARTLVRLYDADRGSVRYGDLDVLALRGAGAAAVQPPGADDLSGPLFQPQPAHDRGGRAARGAERSQDAPCG